MTDTIRGRFLWHDLMTSDPQATIAFYSRVVGWEKVPWEQDPSYAVLGYRGSPMAGVLRLPPDASSRGAPPMWTPYIGCPDVQVTAWEAQRLGGTLLKEPEKTPNVGTWAILKDPQGAAFAAYTPETAPKVAGEPGRGDFSWHELATTDHRAAFAFYRELFGWKKTGTHDRGAAGEYLMYGVDKRKQGGMYSRTRGDRSGSPAWLSFIRVPDAKVTTRSIQQAGGTITLAPHEVPGGDVITVARDPQGAAFAIHQKHAAAKPRPAPRKKVTRRTARKAKKSKTKVPKNAKPGKARRK